MLRVGLIAFSNANPLFYALKEKKVPCNVELIEDHPVAINRLLKEGSLDIALISSAEFLQHRSEYIMLSNLGVAATGPIMSVRLFYKTDPLSLEGSTVLVPPISKTSVRLLQCLAQYFWKVQVNFTTFTCLPEELLDQEYPFLLIGDDCLRLWEKKCIKSIDLGEAWNDATNKSFVYSLIGTRVSSFKNSPEEIVSFHADLEKSFQWGMQHVPEIVDYSAKMSHCSRSSMEQYLYRLEHNLCSKHFHGLNYYATLEVS